MDRYSNVEFEWLIDNLMNLLLIDTQISKVNDDIIDTFMAMTRLKPNK